MKKKRFQDALAREPSFRSMREYLSVDGRTGIAIDPKNKKACFFTSRSPNQVVKFSDIEACEIVEDLDPRTRPPSGHGPLIDSLVLLIAILLALAGGVERIIRGIMARSPKPQKANGIIPKVACKISGIMVCPPKPRTVNRVTLRVVCKDDKQTDHEITFLCEKTERGGRPNPVRHENCW